MNQTNQAAGLLWEVVRGQEGWWGCAPVSGLGAGCDPSCQDCAPRVCRAGARVRNGRKRRRCKRSNNEVPPSSAPQLSSASRGLCWEPAPLPFPARGTPRVAAPGWVSLRDLPQPAGIRGLRAASPEPAGTRCPEPGGPTWGSGVTGGGGCGGRRAGRLRGGGHSPALKAPAGPGLFPRHPGVLMAPAVPLAVLALVALVAPGLGVATGCDYPPHRWCSSRDTAVACKVRTAAAVGVGDKGRVTRHAGPPAPPGTRGQGWGSALATVPGASASCEPRAVSHPRDARSLRCHTGTVALPSIPGEWLWSSRTPTAAPPQLPLALLLFQCKTAFRLILPQTDPGSGSTL